MQSTNHVVMIEPASFYTNPETVDTNVYQVQNTEAPQEVFEKALREFRTFRDTLVENGVTVTTLRGDPACPDAVFPNGFCTHEDGPVFICPMHNKNRQRERTPALLNLLDKLYTDIRDWTFYEEEGLSFEGTASICMDRVHKIGYAGLSARTDRALVEKWAAVTGYEAVIFETEYKGLPVYHTDCLLYIGTTMAALCTPCIVEKDRARVLDKLGATHEVMELTIEQLAAFSGNALEVRGQNNRRMLAISQGAYDALGPAQCVLIDRHFDAVLSAPLTTLETYGGGSARCMLAELF